MTRWFIYQIIQQARDILDSVQGTRAVIYKTDL